MMLLLVFAFMVAGAANARFVREARDAVDQETHQCEYNGKLYNEGEELPTRHMCLICRCTKEFIEPNSQYCDVIDCPETNHVEQGCEPLYNESDCCPIDWNCDNIQLSPTKCDPRYFKHYEVIGCSPTYEDGNVCPARFHCPPSDQTNQDPSVCMYKGRTYQLRDSIETSNPCEICSCLERFDEAASITCISVECPSVFGVRPAEGCYEVYESGKCCSVRTECLPKDPAEPEKTCVYNDKTYHLGQKIYSEEDPCLICQCTENWTGMHDNSCKLFDCNLERRLKDLQDGCIPIYHEKTCCPIEFYCGSTEEGFRNETTPLANNADIESGNSCNFKGQNYAVGQTLEINHPTNCVTCTCSAPPIFTCIHKSCPGPPNDDYENCISTYTPGHCCPTYNCPQRSRGAPMPVPQCSPVKCPAGCSEFTVHNSCPFCMCGAILCSPPRCEDGCEVEKETAPGQCPQCACPGDVQPVRPNCGPVKCSAQCYEAISPQGCPMCICGPLCSPPKCETGCKIQRDVGEGECPGCICPNSDGSVSLEQNIQCSPVKCPSSCHETTGDHGCPACACDPLCSPPKCETGCYVDPHPTGPCPGCVCDGQKPSTEIQCAPVKCGPLCHEAYGENGCPTCLCDPMCSPPQCEAGCHLDYDPSAGPCPGCVCDNKSFDALMCSPVKCDPTCREVFDPNGCPSCFCDPLCSVPYCEPGCHVVHDPASGLCPECACVNKRGIQCSPVKCESYCHEVIIEGGCPTCQCPLCTRPKCDKPGCRINSSTKPCPSCVCDDNTSKISGIQCSPVKCEPHCYEDIIEGGCPTCICPSCTRPKCDDPGCRIDSSTKPCPSCVCDYNPSKLTSIQCSPPKCDPGCRIDYNTEPCPSCACDYNQGKFSDIQCSPPKCDPGCRIDYNTQPCPSCACDYNQGKLTDIQCSPPICDPGCRIDFNTSPCPSCVCDYNQGKFTDIQCSPPKCDPGCRIDSSTSPCPSCVCDYNQGKLTGIQCSPPKCDPGCRIDSSTSPCPSCVCDYNQGIFTDVQCSPPKCDPGCQINYDARPCPSCNCDYNQGMLTGIQCSPPKCDSGCRIDYDTSPCPSCVCGQGKFPGIQCAPVNCASQCPEVMGQDGCPTCDCRPLCSIPRCGPGCHVDNSAYPCPTCTCGHYRKRLAAPSRLTNIQCAPVKCAPSCQEIMGENGCATCRCPLCSPPKCEPGCEVELVPTSGPCPGCVCSNRVGQRLSCPQMSCMLPCRMIRLSQYGCPSCLCHSFQCQTLNCNPGYIEKIIPPERCPECVPENSTDQNVQCSPPKCDPDCRIEVNPDLGPCPACIC